MSSLNLKNHNEKSTNNILDDVLQHGLSDIMLDDPFVVVVGQVFPNSSSDVPMCDDDANTSLGDYNGCVMWVNKNQNPQNPSNRKDLDERRKSMYQEKEESQLALIEGQRQLEKSTDIKVPNYDKQFIDSVKNSYKNINIKISRSEKRCSARKIQIQKLQCEIDKLKDEYNVEYKKAKELCSELRKCKMYSNKYGFSLV